MFGSPQGQTQSGRCVARARATMGREMKKIKGIWLPDGDTHFAAHLEAGPEHDGAGTYQFAKIDMAMKMVPTERRGMALDIGGHVGLWSRVLASCFRGVIAFEPVPHLAECFRR